MAASLSTCSRQGEGELIRCNYSRTKKKYFNFIFVFLLFKMYAEKFGCNRRFTVISFAFLIGHTRQCGGLEKKREIREVSVDFREQLARGWNRTNL